MNRPLLPLARVLVPTDLSPRAEAAVVFAARLAAADGAEVVLLHVLAYPHDWFYWETEALAGLRAHVEREAEGRLAALARRTATPAVRVRPRLAVRSDVASAVLAAADEEGADLVVMGTRGWTGERPELGSVTAQVMRRARCPVLAVPREALAVGAAAGAPAVGRVVVPVDASAAAAEALRTGYALAAGRGAPLLVVHVADAEALAATGGEEPVGADDAPFAEQYERRVRRFAEAVLGTEPDVRLAFAAGRAAGILAAADRTDLLVMTPGHRGGLTEHVLARAPCPVLIVPAPAPAPASDGPPLSLSTSEVSP